MIVFWIIVFGCIFLFVGGNAQDCIDTYPNNWKGKFNGSVSTTVTGQTCMRWQSSKHRDYGKENYCTTISIDDDSANGPWCYTSYNVWEHCFIPLCNKDCISSEDNTKGVFYRGSISVTFNGSSCVQWSAAGAYINQDKNHCRNPDNSTKPWCYIVEKQRIWLYCDIPSCATVCPDLNYSALMLEPTVLTGYKFNEKVRFRCKVGYKLSGSDTLRCTIQPTKTYKGHWDKEQPICIPPTTLCNSLPSDVINSYEVPRTNIKIYSNETITFHCKTGFSGESIEVKCQDDGSWQIPPCKKNPCPELEYNTLLNVNPLLPRLFVFGDDVNFTCKRGYTLVGATTITCLPNGTWSASQPYCQGVSCKDIPKKEHLSSFALDRKYRYPANVTLKCAKGYIITPNNSIRCQYDGSWSTLPTCEGIKCDVLERDENRLFPNISEIYRYPKSITLICHDGFITNGTPTITCRDTGFWDHPTPSCIETAYIERDTIDGGAIGGGVAAAIFIIVLVVLILVVLKRRQTPQKNTDTANFKGATVKEEVNVYSEIRKSDVSCIEDNVDNIKIVIKIPSKDRTYSNEQGGEGGYYDFNEGLQMSNTAIPMAEFYSYVENERGKGGELETQFTKFKTGLQKSTSAALKHDNKIKNKYKSLYPYDETRVILETTNEFPSDFINASYINGYGQLRMYIASQGPQDNTVNEFWRMVWQVDCGKIVMLTNVFEEAKQKCNHYWPEATGKSIDFDGIVVTLTKEDIYSDFTIRRIKMQKETHKKKVTQFHFTAWPDKDVPKYSSSLVYFRHKVNSTTVSGKGPVVVHCSAGIGRTGTYIALDYVVTEAKEVGYVDVFRCVETLRRQRVNMVQTAHQYIFLHDTILEALMCANSGIPAKDFPDAYKNLMKYDPKKKKHKLYVEYDLLNSMSRKHDEEVFEMGKSAENKSKNRYSNIIPVGSEMPRLISIVEGHNDYINAVFLPGYKSSRAFVITHMPMSTTVIDFWRLVNDYKISIIVMLNLEYDETDVYWPDKKDEVLLIGPFKIEQKSLVKKKHSTVIEVSTTSNHDVRRIHIFQQRFWNEEKTVPDRFDDLFSFIRDVEEVHGKESREGPLLVHCLNGCDKSGLYCVMATLIERLRIEQDVDIQHIIKQMRNRRPQIIPNYEQFQFLYEAVIEYLKEFETYANFS